MMNEQEWKKAEEEIQGMLSEQVDSVLRMWMNNMLSDKALKAYLLKYNVGALSDIVMMVLRLMKEAAEDIADEDIVGYMRGELSPEKTEQFKERVVEKTGMSVEEFVEQVTELDGACNRYMNELIDADKFLKDATDFSKPVLAAQLIGLLEVVSGRVKEKITKGMGRESKEARVKPSTRPPSLRGEEGETEGGGETE